MDERSASDANVDFTISALMSYVKEIQKLEDVAFSVSFETQEAKKLKTLEWLADVNYIAQLEEAIVIQLYDAIRANQQEKAELLDAQARAYQAFVEHFSDDDNATASSIEERETKISDFLNNINAHLSQLDQRINEIDQRITKIDEIIQNLKAEKTHCQAIMEENKLEILKAMQNPSYIPQDNKGFLSNEYIQCVLLMKVDNIFRPTAVMEGSDTKNVSPAKENFDTFNTLYAKFCEKIQEVPGKKLTTSRLKEEAANVFKNYQKKEIYEKNPGISQVRIEAVVELNEKCKENRSKFAENAESLLKSDPKIKQMIDENDKQDKKVSKLDEGIKIAEQEKEMLKVEKEMHIDKKEQLENMKIEKNQSLTPHPT
jgi:hypothetical protein